MTGQDFRGDRSRFRYERSRFSWWKVEIFMTTGRDFYVDSPRVYCEQLSFL